MCPCDVNKRNEVKIAYVKSLKNRLSREIQSWRIVELGYTPEQNYLK